MSKEIKGTKEWSDISLNICSGCEHGCKYCYAAYDAVKRFHRIENYEDWMVMNIRKANVHKKATWHPGKTIMFPTTHDITPSILNECIITIQKQLAVGNKLLIVSKPHQECIHKICEVTKHYKDQILFRFTIGSSRDNVLQIWEPNAPAFRHRLFSLQHAYYKGFKTSVSCEPMLDSFNIRHLYECVKPYITDAFWIGKMNNIESRVQPDVPKIEIERINIGQTDERILEIYEDLKYERLVKWKESIKKIVGLKLAERSGEDN
jgi:DNA repair photolyase